MKTILFLTIWFAGSMYCHAQPKYFQKTLPPIGSHQHVTNIINTGSGNFLAIGSHFYYEYETPFGLIIDNFGNAIYTTEYPLLLPIRKIHNLSFLNNSIRAIGVAFNVNRDTSYIALSSIDAISQEHNVMFVAPDNFLKSGLAVNNTSEHNLIIGGYSVYYNTSSSYVPSWVAYAVKTDTLGNVIWQHRYTADFDTTKHSYIYSILPIPESSDMFYWGLEDGINNVNPAQADVFLARADSAGTILWKKKFNFGSWDVVSSVTWTPDQKMVYCGTCHTFDTGALRGCLVKVDTLGNVIWAKPMPEVALSGRFIMVNEGREYVLGNSEYMGTAQSLDAAIIKTDSSGNILWKRYYGGAENDYAYCIAPSDDGGYLIMGRKDTAAIGKALVYMVKTNCMGLLTQPTAAFTHYQTGDNPLEVAFINQSEYVYPDSIDGGHYILDFGDGSPPLVCGRGYAPCASSILHTYAHPNTYTASLMAVVCSDTSTISQPITVAWTSADPISHATKPHISHNNHTLYIHQANASPLYTIVQIYDLNGKQVLEQTPNRQAISISHLPNGIYLLRLQTLEGNTYNQKLVLVK